MVNTTTTATASPELGDAAHLQRSLDRLLRASEQLRRTIDIDPEKRGGAPVLMGTRFKVSQFLAQLAEGDSLSDLEEDLDLDRDVMQKFLQALSVILDRPWTTHPNED